MNEAPLPLDAERSVHVAGAASGKVWRVRAVLVATLLASAALALAAMAARPALPLGFWLGAVAIFLASAVTLLFVDTFRSVAADAEAGARSVAAPALNVVLAAFVLWLSLRLAVLGVIPAQTAVLAAAVPASFTWLVASAAVVLERLGFLAEPGRSLLGRHGFWLIALTTLLYLPRLGSVGLIDPWETHYGEVAREILSRDDWISLWWAQDGWFWSKPILNFWTQALSFLAFGVEWAPDRMIATVAEGRLPQPEWAARLPTFVVALAGQYVLYLGARAYLGRTAAFLGSLALMTMPYWYMLAHQSMADMVYVGPMCAAMGFLLLALRADADAQVRTVFVKLGRSRGFQVSGYHLLFGALLLAVLPQVLYLVSRNVSLEWGDVPLRLRLHVDRVAAGSPGNCGLPGNAGCNADVLVRSLQPAAAALLWSSAMTLLIVLRSGERRAKRLLYLAAWFCTGLSFMGKGAPGLVLVLFTFGAFVLARGRLAEIRRADFVGFGLVTAAVVLPWFVQEYVRHGTEFFERLFIHDMYQRAFSHVHDTNKGDDTSFRYYVWQLGYGLFPWSGVAAAGTLVCLARTLGAPAQGDGEAASAARGVSDIAYFCLLWQLAAFGMFAITGTKFHHYALPLVPAAALPAGVLLAGLLKQPGEARSAAATRSLALGSGIGSLALGSGIGSLALGCAVLAGLAGRDLAVTRAGDLEGSVRLLHLFTYNYSRPWPDTLDYSAVFWAFTSAAVVFCLLFAVPKLRRAAVLALSGLGVVVTAWVLDVYMVEIAPHWGQRETISAYYERRAGPEEPLVAYQLNWKGENFYTGNKVPAFVSSGKRFTEWVEGQKKAGVKVMFFTTEHSRIGTLKRELGGEREVELLTDAALNNKFVLARAVL